MPALLPSPGVYQWVFRHDGRERRYVGEAENLRRRFAKYTAPGPSQSTNLRMRERERRVCDAGGSIELLGGIFDQHHRRRDQKRAGPLFSVCPTLRRERCLGSTACLWPQRGKTARGMAISPPTQYSASRHEEAGSAWVRGCSFWDRVCAAIPVGCGSRKTDPGVAGGGRRVRSGRLRGVSVCSVPVDSGVREPRHPTPR
jgi:hypothetical protein